MAKRAVDEVAHQLDRERAAPLAAADVSATTAGSAGASRPGDLLWGGFGHAVRSCARSVTEAHAAPQILMLAVFRTGASE